MYVYTCDLGKWRFRCVLCTIHIYDIYLYMYSLFKAIFGLPGHADRQKQLGAAEN